MVLTMVLNNKKRPETRYFNGFPESGDEGSRTPVRKSVDQAFSERSL